MLPDVAHEHYSVVLGHRSVGCASVLRRLVPVRSSFKNGQGLLAYHQPCFLVAATLSWNKIHQETLKVHEKKTLPGN